jgi:hypothetical protein
LKTELNSYTTKIERNAATVFTVLHHTQWHSRGKHQVSRMFEFSFDLPSLAIEALADTGAKANKAFEQLQQVPLGRSTSRSTKFEG